MELQEAAQELEKLAIAVAESAINNTETYSEAIEYVQNSTSVKYGTDAERTLRSLITKVIQQQALEDVLDELK